MIILGIRAHDLGEKNAEALAKKVKQYELKALQLVVHKAIDNNDGSPQSLTEDFILDLRKTFNQYKIDVGLLGAYFNPIHHDADKTKKAIEKFKDHLIKAKLFGTNLVGTETGSYNNDQWTYHENNDSEEAFYEVQEIIGELIPIAENNDSYIAIEGARHHVVTTPEKMKRLQNDLKTDRIKFIVDLYNLLDYETANDADDTFDRAIQLLGKDIEVFHFKDYLIDHEKKALIQVAPGKGLMNYRHILAQIGSLNKDVYCIFEGVTGDDIAFSIKYINGLIKEMEVK